MDREVARNSDGDEITLQDFVSDLKRARIMFFSLVAILTLGGGAIGLLRDRDYEATTMLSPVAEDPSTSRLGGIAALASQYSGLASLAGIALPGSGKKDEAIAVLQSELLTEQYVKDNDLLPILFSSTWDSVSGKWKTDDPKKIPTLWRANRYFKGTIRSVVDDKRSGLIEMRIRWKDPKLAAAWANGIVKAANSYLRDKAIREAERDITYLNEQVSKTNVIEAQRTIYSLLAQELNKEMVARGREEYALKVIDPAFAPERPIMGGPLLLALLGFTLACLLSVTIVFIRRALLS
jgi:uncharacterized protein involved in exopolysaccharide biosynthesis